MLRRLPLLLLLALLACASNAEVEQVTGVSGTPLPPALPLPWVEPEWSAAEVEEAEEQLRDAVQVARCRSNPRCRPPLAPPPPPPPPPDGDSGGDDDDADVPAAAEEEAVAQGPRPPPPRAAPAPRPPPPPPPGGLNLTVAPRLELSQLARNSLMVDLLLLSMAALQAKPATDPTSFQALAGIHGEPYTSYRGIVPAKNAWTLGQASKRWGGYCTHSGNLFPTWHRPYMALMEQALMTEALIIAQQYPDNKRAAYVATAQVLRLPYWDWANDATIQHSLPTLLSSAKWTVNHPQHGKTKINNPLAGYTMNAAVNGPNTSNKFPLYMPKGQPSARWPSPNDAHPKTHNALLIPQIQAAAKQWQKQILNVLLNPNWKCFSNNAAWVAASLQPTAACPLMSLEGLHDQIHALVGGSQGIAPNNIQGTMALLEVAAFDPLFFLHHSNVDRILALWQQLHPTTYVSTGTDKMGTYYTPPGAFISSHSALTPFIRGAPWSAADAASGSSGGSSPKKPSFYNSWDVASTETFGYTYPDLEDDPSPTALWSALHAMYHGSSGLRWHLSIDAIPLAETQPDFAIDVFVLPHPGRRRHSLHRRSALSSDTDASSGTHAAGHSNSSGAAAAAALLAGSIHVFVSGAGFMKDSGAGVRGTVDLTAALLEQGYVVDAAAPPTAPGSDAAEAFAAPQRAPLSFGDLRLVAAVPRDADLVARLARTAYIAYHQSDAFATSGPQDPGGRSETTGGGGPRGLRTLGAFAADGRTRIARGSGTAGRAGEEEEDG